ncbi:hypothetical protein VNO77_27591 [Canavalia gladiata]|uniref:Uncharacterized protein n=1 Tax=Canavalia gladiata TaxID=3824 RepID=A0AAN9KUY3_CANGL
MEHIQESINITERDFERGFFLLLARFLKTRPLFSLALYCSWHYALSFGFEGVRALSFRDSTHCHRHTSCLASAEGESLVVAAKIAESSQESSALIVINLPGMVLDVPKASQLLGVITSNLPICSDLRPVHDPSGRVYINVQNMWLHWDAPGHVKDSSLSLARAFFNK